MVDGNGAALMDEIKVRAVVALCNELQELSPNDPQYAIALRRLDEHWRTLSPAEQDAVDRIFGQRGLLREE